jgi:hypothetical protein
MKNTILFVLTLSSLAPTAHTGGGLDRPQIGFVRDSAGTVRELVGVRGSLLLKDPIAEAVVSCAFSHRGGVLKTGRELLVLRRDGSPEARFTAPAGRAITAFSEAGLPALVFFPSAREAWLLEGPAKRSLPVIFDDEVVSAYFSRLPVFLVRRGEVIWRLAVSPASGHVIRESPVFVASDLVVDLPEKRVLSVAGTEAILRSASGMERRMTLPIAIQGIERAGPGVVVLRGERQSLLLWTKGPALRIDYLPEVAR